MPVFVSVKVCVGALPRFTLPKEMFAGLTESVAAAAVTLPLRRTVAGEDAAVLVSETLPLTFPVDCAVNCTLKLLDCPAARVSGTLNPVVLKPAPVTFA